MDPLLLLLFVLFHLAVLSNSLRCGSYGTFLLWHTMRCNNDIPSSAYCCCCCCCCTDYIGRLPVYHMSLISVLGASIGAALSPNIAVLLVCRSLQGLAAAGTFAVGNATVADVYPPSRRGFAFGVYMMPGVSFRGGLGYGVE